MTTPVIVIEVDHHAPQVLSPFKDYSTVSSGNNFDDHDDDIKNKRNSSILKPRIKDWRRNRKSHMVDIDEYIELNRKYEEAKKRIGRMRESSANNRRLLLEMSSVINALKDISIEYDHDETAATTPIQNVQKKIRAIDAQLRGAMLQCGHLEQEKELQSTMIKEQEEQIKIMEERITELQEQLQQSLNEKKHQVESEKKALKEMNQKGARTSKIEAQQAKIAALEDEVRIISMEDATGSTLHQQIQALNGSHQAKYLEIQEMERKLALLRDAQKGLTADKSPKSRKQVSFVPETFSRRNSHSSSSSCTGHSSSLASVMEENSGDEEEDEDNDGIYSDDRGSSFSTRSFSTDDSSSTNSTTKEGDRSASIKIATSEDDESVEIIVNGKSQGIDVSEVSYSTEETVETATVNFEKEYNEAMRVIRELRGENEKLRKSHSQALSNIAQVSELTYHAEQTKKECEDLKRVVETQQQLAKQADAQYEKLHQEHTKAMKDLKEERARYAQLMQDYSKVSHRQTEIENHEKLKVMHDALVMKVGDMAEENESLVVRLNDAHKERDQAESKARQLASEVDAINNAYKELQTENDTLMDKFTETSQEADSFKTKYYELLANDVSTHSQSTSSKDERFETLRGEYESALSKLRDMDSIVHASEKQKRDYAEALSKIQALEECNKELEQVREKFHTAEAQVTLLKKEVAKKAEAEKLARKREEQRVWHLKDMISHYKVLENEHDEVCQKLQRLQALVGSNKDHDSSRGSDNHSLEATSPESSPSGGKTVVVSRKTIAGYEQQIKELLKQQDRVFEELSRLEDELSQARLEKVEATTARKDREQDLKVLLEHYRSLQRENDALKSTIKEMEKGLLSEETRHSANTDNAVLIENKSEEVEEGYTSELCESAKVTENLVELSPNEEDEDDKNNDDTVSGDADIVSEAPIDDATQDTKIGMTIAKNESPTNKTNTSTTQLHTISSNSKNLDVVEAPCHPQMGGETTAEVKADADDDTVTRLLIDMEILKRRKEERLADEKAVVVDSKTDASSVSNVSEGLSMENSLELPDQDGSALSDEAPSTSWKDVKIAQLVSELDKAKAEIWELEQKEKSAQTQLEITEQKLLVAHREADEAKKRQNAREGNLRDAVANQRRWEAECKQIQKKVATLEEQLEQAKRDTRLREEEIKAARQRAAEYHTQCKKLQEKHDTAMKLMEEQVRRIETLEESPK